MNNNEIPINPYIPQDVYEMSKEANLESEDSYKYEIDTQIFIERIYYFWIGYTKMEGEWVRDPHRTPIMTQELADILKNEIEYRVNTHSFLSTYDADFIKKVSIESAIVINNTLMFQLEKYKMNVYDFQRIIMALKHIFMSLLRIAHRGHMVNYRMNKGKINIIRQESNVGGMI